MSRLLRIPIGIAAAAAALALLAALFLLLWKPLGGSATEEQRADYARRAPNFDGRAFRNEGGLSVMHSGGTDPGRVSSNGRTPAGPLPVAAPDLSADFSATWLGHSSLFMRIAGRTVLFDPVFSDVISPVPLVGVRRFSRPAVSVAELPPIDVLVLTHDHYDHLDYDVIREIDPKVSRYAVPLGVENHLVRWGVDRSKITEMAWWEGAEFGPLRLTCTPSRHFSGRRLVDSMATLWCSWVVEGGGVRVFESGDSGWGGHFAEIGRRLGPFDAAFMECGQYDGRWPEIHMFPEQSARAARELGAEKAVPMHWGAMALALNGWDDGAERFVRAAEAMDPPLAVETPLLSRTIPLRGRAEGADGRWWRGLE